MSPFLWFLFCLFGLSFTRNSITNSFVRLSLKSTRSPKLGIFTYSLLYFPGTLIHELSHALMAIFLGVRTGKLHLFPKFDPKTKSLALGSVEIEKKDFFRLSLIGAAPTFFGILIIYFLTLWRFPNLSITQLSDIPSTFFSFLTQTLSALELITLYLIITIAGSFHLSSSDRRPFPLVIIFSLPLIILIYFLNASLFPQAYQLILPAISGLASVLTFALFLNFLLSVALWLLNRLVNIFP